MAYEFLKGHGTENDFVLLPDLDGSVHGDLTPERVRALCDRRAGIGGDGVLRVVRSTQSRGRVVHGLPQLRRLVLGDVRQRHPALRPLPGRPRPGRRVRTDPRRHPRRRQDAHGRRRPDHRRPGRAQGPRRDHGRRSEGITWAARHVDIGNPHAVAFVDPPSTRPGRCSSRRPTTPRSTPTASTSSSSYALASGTSRCASTSAAPARPAPAAPARVRRWWPRQSRDDVRRPQRSDVAYRVDVPGGTLTVTWTADDRVLLTGPAVIVRRGTDL